MKNKITTYLILTFISLLFSFQTVNAQANLQDAFKESSSSLAIVAGSEGAGYQQDVALESVIGQIITGLLSLIGIILILYVIYGGILYMSARGNEEQAKKATSIITRAIIGLIIVLTAYAITYFIIKFFT